MIEESLGRSELFGPCSADVLSLLTKSASLTRFRHQDVDILETFSAGVSVLVSGTVSVVVSSETKNASRLIEFAPPDVVLGEVFVQTLKAHNRVKLRTHGTVHIAHLTSEDLTDALERSPDLQRRLAQQQERQRGRLEAAPSSLLYKTLLQLHERSGAGRKESYPPQEEIIREGDVAEHMFLIQGGEAIVHLGEETNVLLSTGDVFGELGLLHRARRSATVSAKTPLEVIAFTREEFEKLMLNARELQPIVALMRNSYRFQRQGNAEYFVGELEDQPAIITLTDSLEGVRLISRYACGSDSIYQAECIDESVNTDSSESFVYQDPEREIRRELVYSGERLIKVNVRGQWDDIHKLQEQMLNGAPIDRDALQQFTTRGALQSSTEPGVEPFTDEIICHCMGVSRGQLQTYVMEGHDTLEKLGRRCGAATECGGCSAQISSLLGAPVGYPVRLEAKQELSPEVCSFSFKARFPLESDVQASRPGQHVVVSAKINGAWVHRPYTLTSPGHATPQREITVKREPNGLFSRWLFENAELDPDVYLSNPRGSFWADLDDPAPIVCFVAGIGMTPALAILRTVSDLKSGHRVHVDYSVRFSDDIIHREALEQLCAANPNLSLQLRISNAGQRLIATDVQGYVEALPGARFFICGTSAYHSTIRTDLLAAGVAADRIHIESFSPDALAATLPSSPLAPPFHRSVAVVGLLLLGAYLLQASLDLRWSWLESLQLQEGYRRWSGAALTLYIAGQFALPIRRLQRDPARLARVLCLHRRIGALSPLVFFAHSTRPGYALLAALSAVFLSNTAMGLFDKSWFKDPATKAAYTRIWLVPHVTLSLLLVGLTALHVFVVFAYQGAQ